PYGIKVSIIQPGPTDTAIWEKTYPEESRYSESIYKERIDRVITKEREQWQKLSLPPIVLAKAIYHALSKKKPKTRYFVSRNKHQQYFISSIPEKWADQLLIKYY
ncbi:MAG: hypothetical protein ACFFBD_10600, partial [Candidatus Hodarchaeota archaeon]